jgi:putative peptidoglycan lipid II flippase
MAQTRHVAPILGCYALCIVGLSAQQVLARGFYAMGEVRIPIGIGLFAMLVFAVFARIFPSVGYGGAIGLSLAAAVAVNCLGFLMWFFLKVKLGGWDDGATLQTLWKSSVAGVAAYFGAFYTAHFLLPFMVQAGLDSKMTPTIVKYAVRGGETAFAAAVGIVLFIGVGAALKLREVDAVTSRFSRRKLKSAPASGIDDK